MNRYRFHLAMAALAGASFVAVSTYYMHQKTVVEFIELINAMGIRGKFKGGNDLETCYIRKQQKRRRSDGRRKHRKELRRTVSSPPRVEEGEIAEEKKGKRADQVEGIPIRISKLHPLSEGMALSDFSPE